MGDENGQRNMSQSGQIKDDSDAGLDAVISYIASCKDVTKLLAIRDAAAGKIIASKSSAGIGTSGVYTPVKGHPTNDGD